MAKPELSPAGIRHGKPLRVSRVRELSAAARPDAVRAQSLAAQNSLRSAPSLSRAIDLTLESSRSRVECFLLERLTAHAEIEVEGMLTLSRTDRDVGVQLQSDTEFHDGLRVLNVEKRQATSHRMTWRELGGGDTRTWLLEGAIDKGDWIDIRTMLWGTKFSQHQAPHGGTPRISPCFLLEQLRNNRLPESMTLATDGSARIHVADGLRHRFEALTVMSSPPMHSIEALTIICCEASEWQTSFERALGIALADAKTEGAAGARSMPSANIRSVTWTREDRSFHSRYWFAGNSLMAIELQLGGLWAWRSDRADAREMMTSLRSKSPLADSGK